MGKHSLLAAKQAQMRRMVGVNKVGTSSGNGGGVIQVTGTYTYSTVEGAPAVEDNQVPAHIEYIRFPVNPEVTQVTSIAFGSSPPITLIDNRNEDDPNDIIIATINSNIITISFDAGEESGASAVFASTIDSEEQFIIVTDAGTYSVTYVVSDTLEDETK